MTGFQAFSIRPLDCVKIFDDQSRQIAVHRDGSRRRAWRVPMRAKNPDPSAYSPPRREFERSGRRGFSACRSSDLALPVSAATCACQPRFAMLK